MASWFHTTVLSIGMIASVAVGVASAGMLANINPVATKGDLLARAPVDDGLYQTVETRGVGVSMLTRVHAD